VARPRTDIGTFGEFAYSTTGSGKVQARVRFRDDDGQLRLVQATGSNRSAAQRALKLKLTERENFTTGDGELTPDTMFPRLVEVWLADLELEGRLSPKTRAGYELSMRMTVLPAFQGFRLREITVGRVDRFLKLLAANDTYSRAKHAKVVLSLAFGMAVRHEAVARNPVRETARLRKPPSTAMALTRDQVEAIRAAVRAWRRGPGRMGPKPDGQLGAIIEVMLGTSARIGEVLAIRKCDVDVTASVPTVRLAGTVVSVKGRGTYRQDHPKTAKSVRTVSVPSFAAEAIRGRLVALSDQPPEGLLFQTKNHTPITTNNVRRLLRAVLAEAGIEGVTPHSFRRTVATVLDRAGGADLAAEMLGHTSSAITKAHYIEPDEKVNPVTADILEALAPRRG
jgi:integrase